MKTVRIPPMVRYPLAQVKTSNQAFIQRIKKAFHFPSRLEKSAIRYQFTLKIHTPFCNTSHWKRLCVNSYWPRLGVYSGLKLV